MLLCYFHFHALLRPSGGLARLIKAVMVATSSAFDCFTLQLPPRFIDLSQ
jgi:hypothetical protein